MPVVISVVGKSDSGKTTLIEKLVPELTRRGYRVGTIKHNAHGFDLDHEGKDSRRHKQAGAEAVALSSPSGFAFIRDVERELSIDQIVSGYFGDMDIVITEGYKREGKPKIEVFRRGGPHREILCANDDTLIALVTDAEVEVSVPRFGLEEAGRLADYLEGRFLSKAPGKVNPSRMTGIILAGGKGVRFGGNKALTRMNGNSLIEWIIETYREIFGEILISTNDPPAYAFTGIRTVRDIIPHKGPLVGIYSSLLETSHELAFVSACDMPFIRPSLIRHMVDVAEGYDVVIPSLSEGMLEPLHALYRKTCLPAMKRAVEGHKRRVVSFFPEVRVYTMSRDEISRHDPDLLSFFNINTREDLERAKERFRLLRYSASPGCRS